MTTASRRFVIPLDPDYDESQAEYMKHRRIVPDATNPAISDSIEERVPKLSQTAKPFEILRFLSNFSRARRHLQWTTGPILFSKFPLHLDGYHLRVWELTIAGMTKTVAHFEEAMQDFSDKLLEEYNYEDQMDYLRSIKKPPKMSPGEFLMKLRDANEMVAQLPRAPEDDPGFTEDQLARIYLLAMPHAWQNNFENANLSVHTTTLSGIRRYMDMQALKDPYVPKTQRSNSSQNSNRNRNFTSTTTTTYNRSNNQGTNPSQRNQNRRGRGGQTNRPQSQIQGTDRCPLPGHQGHTWGECRQNRFGNNAQGNNQQGQGQGNNN